MNSDEFKGGVRYVAGKAEKAVGDAVDSRDWRVDGVVDQVAGAAQHTYGRARSVVEDAIDAAPDLADEAIDRAKVAGRRIADGAKVAGERIADGAQRGGQATVQAVEDSPVLWAAAAALGGYALGWLVHGRRD